MGKISPDASVLSDGRPAQTYFEELPDVPL